MRSHWIFVLLLLFATSAAADTVFPVSTSAELSDRIGNGAGFWGDQLDAPRLLAEQGNLDYLTLEYLAELTLSILAHQRQRDATLGYVTDLPTVVQSLVAVLQTQSQNTQAAESSIRDANVAEEVANLTKYQILAQSGIAALAQANANSQSVLSLLRG